MKKILFLFFTLALLTSCEKDPVDKGKFDPNAMITIRPADGVQLKSTVSGLTATEIVEQGHEMLWQSHWFDNRHSEKVKNIYRWLDETFKDLDKPAFKTYATDVITEKGDYTRDLTYAFNVFITNTNGDTIAYVPDDVIADARVKIEAAFEDGNYNEVYMLLDEAFTFYPMPE